MKRAKLRKKIPKCWLLLKARYNADLWTVGYKGRTFIDNGFFNCPYVPAMINNGNR